MLEDNPTGSDAASSAAPDAPPAKKTAAKKTAAKKTAAKRTAAKKTAAKKATPRKSAAKAAAPEASSVAPEAGAAPAKKTAGKKTAAKKAAKAPAKKAAAPKAEAEPDAESATAVAPLFQAPDAVQVPARKPREKAAPAPADDEQPSETDQFDGGRDSGDDAEGDSGDGSARRRRRRGGRRRRKPGGEGEDAQVADQDAPDEDQQSDQTRGAQNRGGQNKGGQGRGGQNKSGQNKGGQGGGKAADSDEGDEGGESPSSRRRRRRRRAGEEGGDPGDDPQNTVTRVRKTRSAEDQITAVSGSTRLEAKKQRRREGREAGRRRAPIVSEAEFLARRESVERVMAIRQRDDLTQIAVLEDKVLVEHYVARESQTSLIGNVYIGRVQNVLPSMEAAFIDIGKGRNAVLYAGEVNWSALGHKDGQPRKIESVLSSGQAVLVQVTKDPVGHKGARLTSQISLAGRFLVYVPDGTNSGISRKLPDTERTRLKSLLKEIVPDSAGVIVRTAAEGASEDELTRDVERLKARWDDIEKKSKGSAPQLLYGEPDLMLKVVRDLFTEDFAKLVIQGSDAWETVKDYVTHVAPDLEERLEEYDASTADLFSTYRIDEQIHKGLDRKVWLPSGGSLIIDRTEAMTVVDVNTGKFTGSGGNLEETVTKNNLEAAEEMVRQLRLRDIGGIIVIDFIDMVLESNRDLVLRRLVECLGRDRTRHQVAEVTSLGLVQMTRKRIGTGLLEAFSENCEHCAGRGVIIADAPIEPKKDRESKRGSRRSRGGRGRDDDSGQPNDGQGNGRSPSPKDVAAMARTPKPDDDEESATTQEAPEPETVEVSTGSTSVREPESPAVEPVETKEPAPETTPEPAAPKVVTRTRRRSASRPAGPPATSATDQGEAPAAPATPVPLGTVGEPPTDGVVEPGTAAAEGGTRPVVEHVPVKKRGSRKR